MLFFLSDCNFKARSGALSNQSQMMCFHAEKRISKVRFADNLIFSVFQFIDTLVNVNIMSVCKVRGLFLQL